MRRDPNDCAECARQHGPHYTGPCDHGEAPKPGAPTVYTPEQLRREARRMVKGFGKFVRYDLIVHNRGVQLRAAFIRHRNPLKPDHVQATEFTTMSL